MINEKTDSRLTSYKQFIAIYLFLFYLFINITY